MGMRVFGRTGMRLSVLGFRSWAFGPGLRLRRGRRTNGSRRLARPGAHGGAGDRNYFDTAVQYGDGESEKNLGSVPRWWALSAGNLEWDITETSAVSTMSAP